MCGGGGGVKALSLKHTRVHAVCVGGRGAVKALSLKYTRVHAHVHTRKNRSNQNNQHDKKSTRERSKGQKQETTVRAITQT